VPTNSVTDGKLEQQPVEETAPERTAVDRALALLVAVFRVADPTASAALLELLEHPNLAFRAALREALTHPSYANERMAQQGVAPAHYQRLEFLGDSVLSLAVARQLMAAHPKASEGQLSAWRSWLVNTEALAEWARTVALSEALLLGKGALTTGEQHRENVLADGVEAIIGALYCHGGWEHASALVAEITRARFGALPSVKASADSVHGGGGDVARDAKSLLQEWVQGAGMSAPSYVMTSTSGPSHDRVFCVTVRVAEQDVAFGEGRSKKAAEQMAAQQGLSLLRAACDAAEREAESGAAQRAEALPLEGTPEQGPPEQGPPEQGPPAGENAAIADLVERLRPARRS
jgi:ribonuclease-3